jgi:hypothetical protein
MGDRSGRTPVTVLALAVAVAGTGLVGYLISRPGSVPHTPRPPLQSIAPQPAPTPTAQPSAAGFSVADDSATGQVLVFGGSSGSGADTWIWKGTGWTLAAPTTQPPPLYGASAVYDPVSRVVMLAGGGSFEAAGNDGTWSWDGETWQELDADITRPPVAGGTLGWDPALQQMVLVTPASAGDNSSSQTWLWAGNHWMPRGGPSPFPANALQIAFDPSSDELVAMSCCLFSSSLTVAGDAQMWRWDGAAWHFIADTSLPPIIGAVFGLGWDASSHSLLMSGQELSPQTPLTPVLTWRLVSREWVALRATGAPVVSGASLIETDDGLRLVAADSSVEGNSTPYHLWAWTGAGWKQLG